MLIQLPKDAESVGYKLVAPYKYEQVFRSIYAKFEGTEQEFINAGLAYKYTQVDKHTRFKL